MRYIWILIFLCGCATPSPDWSYYDTVTPLEVPETKDGDGLPVVIVIEI